jgi:hypothetical protein
LSRSADALLFSMKKKVCFDPRDESQFLGDPDTWRPTDNPVLISAGTAAALADRTGMSLGKSFWKDVATRADEADANQTDKAQPG